MDDELKEALGCLEVPCPKYPDCDHSEAVAQAVRSQAAEIEACKLDDHDAAEARMWKDRAEKAEAELAEALRMADGTRAADGMTMKLYIVERDSLRAEVERLRAELNAKTVSVPAVRNALDGWKERAESAESTAQALKAEVEKKEADRQYHMNAINRLATRIDALGETSDAVIEKAIRQIAELKDARAACLGWAHKHDKTESHLAAARREISELRGALGKKDEALQIIRSFASGEWRQGEREYQLYLIADAALTPRPSECDKDWPQKPCSLCGKQLHRGTCAPGQATEQMSAIERKMFDHFTVCAVCKPDCGNFERMMDEYKKCQPATGSEEKK